MKGRAQRWIILPFSLGCASRSTVAVSSASDSKDGTPPSSQGRQKDTSIVENSGKYSLAFSLPKPNISRGIRRLIRSIRSMSQTFVHKDEMENEVEMEIGYPTDVKHLTHIGWDGSTTINNPVKGWENLTPSEIISFPSISLKQFELAMAAQANGNAPSQQLTISPSKPKLS